MNRQHDLPIKLARVGFAVTLIASIATLGGCGEAPGELEEITFAIAEPGPNDPDPASFEESSRVVDKQAFIDGSLSCSSVPDRTCPGVTLRMANRSMFIGDGSGQGFSLPLNPAPPVQELFLSGDGMRAGIDLSSISCRASGGQQVIFTEELLVRFATETRLNALSNGTAQVSPPSPASNYPDAGTFTNFACPNSRIGVVAAGFEANVVQGSGRFVSFRRVTDAQTLRDGTAQFFVRCETSLNLDSIVIERDRPRDLLSTSGGQFVDGLSLSASERQQRCNNLCFNDCSVDFGVDALGAQNCTDVCTPDCVNRATSNTDLCPPTQQCNACSQPSDCGSPSGFTCSSGCCFQIIF